MPVQSSCLNASLATHQTSRFGPVRFSCTTCGVRLHGSVTGYSRSCRRLLCLLLFTTGLAAMIAACEILLSDWRLLLWWRTYLHEWRQPVESATSCCATRSVSTQQSANWRGWGGVGGGCVPPLMLLCQPLCLSHFSPPKEANMSDY